MQEKLEATQFALSSVSDNLDKAQDKCTGLYSTLRVERRKLQRTAARKGLLERQIKLLKSVEHLLPEMMLLMPLNFLGRQNLRKCIWNQDCQSSWKNVPWRQAIPDRNSLICKSGWLL